MTDDDEAPGPPARDRMLGEALAMFTHDLRNPLAAVMTNVAYAEEVVRSATGRDVAEAREALLDARDGCASLQRIVANLELMARSLADDVARDPPAPLDVMALIEGSIAEASRAAEGRRLRVRSTSATAVHATAGRDLAARALANLIGVAIQHAPAGGEITIAAKVEGGSVAIAIEDAGPAMAAELRPIATSLEGQIASKGRVDGRYGRGLALMAASIAARGAGGEVRIEGGSGSRLVLMLPLHVEGASRG